MPPELCPVCGTDVPPNAKCCPECGADEETGWSERARAQQLGLPDDEFDYDEFIKEEFGEEAKAPQLRPRGIKWLWWVVAIILIVMMLSWLTRLT